MLKNEVNENKKVRPINKLLIVYFVLSIYENVLNTGSSSILKFYGLFIIFVILVKIISGKQSMIISVVSKYYLVWIAICAFSLIWTPDFSLGFDYVQAAGNMIVIGILAFSISWNDLEITRLFQLYSFSALTFAFWLIFGHASFHGTSARYTVSILGVEYDPNVIVAFLIPSAILLVVLMMHKKINMVVAICSFVIITYASFLANSRGGLLAFGISLLFFFIAAIIKGSIKKKQIKYYVVFIIVLIITIFIVTRYVDPYLLNRVFKLDLTEGSSISRIGLIKEAWELFLEHPIIGIGCGGANAITGQGTHNMYLLVLCETGILGFIPFAIALIMQFAVIWKSKRWEYSAVLVATCGAVFFLDSYHAKYLWNTIIFLLIYQSYLMQSKQNEK